MNNHPYCHVACPYASGGVLGGDDVTIKYKGLVWEWLESILYKRL